MNLFLLYWNSGSGRMMWYNRERFTRKVHKAAIVTQQRYLWGRSTRYRTPPCLSVLSALSALSTPYLFADDYPLDISTLANIRGKEVMVRFTENKNT